MNPCMGFLTCVPTATWYPYPYPNVWVRVSWGRGTGSPGKPQGYPCQSLNMGVSCWICYLDMLQQQIGAVEKEEVQ